MAIIDNIKALCAARGITLTDVATRMGVARNTLYISMRADTRVSTLQRIASAIGCDISEFFTPQTTADTSQTDGHTTHNTQHNITCPACGADITIQIIPTEHT